MRLVIAALFSLVLAGMTTAEAALLNISSRGKTIRTVILKPTGTPKGAVILLAGGNGRLDITTAGVITKLTGNHLIRTRQLYVKAGFTVLVPDLAPDMKVGAANVLNGYRINLKYAQDIGAMVKYLRSKGARKVVVIGTSRGSIGAANAVAKMTGTLRPTAQVLSSGFWHVGAVANDLNIWEAANNGQYAKLKIPTLAIWHRGDMCVHTKPSEMPAFKTWYQKNRLTLHQRSFTGGAARQSDHCEAKSPHGFWGLDQSVVNATASWIKALP